MGDILYPSGCKPITEDLGPDELIRRLKALTTTLQAMEQDEGVYQAYIPLALHLADEHFLTHQSRDVQLLIACCIADVLRVYAPEAPYKDPIQVKRIFNFLIKQLNGLRDPKITSFNRYFYLLENLAYVKSFNMCFEIEDSQEIFCNLFGLMFRIVNDEHSSKVKSFMLDVLCPLITESDNVSTQLLDIILINIVEPVKSTRKNAYALAKDLIKKTHETMEQYIQQFFNQVLIMDKVETKFAISSKVYDLIYELNLICPTILVCVMPQLECKLKAGLEVERLKAVSLLARMFSEKDSKLAIQHKLLWRQFLSRYCDIAVSIRIKCVQSSMHFLLNHPHLREDVIESLKFRQHDADEMVRYEVVMAIVETAKRDFQIVSESEDLLEYVKERTLDKKFKIRKEAMNGLALIYRKYLNDSDVPETTKKAVNWINDKILHGYYMTGIEDRLLVERLLITCLVPYQLPPEDRMRKLYRLLGTIDDNATKAFIELQKNQLKVRKTVSDWIKLHRIKEQTPRIQKEITTKCSNIAKQLPEPVKAQEFLFKFSVHMRKDATLLADMETILKRDVSCKECADTMASVLRKLGQPIMTNLYYNTVKMLLERIASVMVDKSSIEILVCLIGNCMNGGEVIEDIDLPPDQAFHRGLKMLTVLSYVFSAHFQHDSILRKMLGLLCINNDDAASYVLKAFTYLGRYKPLIDSHQDVLEGLGRICKELAISGTPKQAKHAIRCMFVNTQQSTTDLLLLPSTTTTTTTTTTSSSSPVPTQGTTSGDSKSHLIIPSTSIDIFGDVVDSFKSSLISGHEDYRTAIVALGHVAYNLPEKYQVQIKNIISRKIVKDLLVKDSSGDQRGGAATKSTATWCQEDELPEETRCKVEGLKTMARWLLGLKQDVLSAQKTFRMLNAFIKQKGDLLEQGNLMPAEMSWLRLSAGTAMLKICEQKGVGDQFTAEQFYNLSQLMVDPVPEVREIFAKKLHKGLSKGIPQKCLPLDFMGYYALGGRETDKRLLQLIRTYVETDVNRRREYIRTVASGVEKAMNQLPHILPDYMLVFAVPVLAHDPNFINSKDTMQLKLVEKCLWLILQPLITNKEFFCYGFYKNIVDRMKHHKDAYKPDDESINHKLWAICDLAMHLIYTKSTNYDVRDFPLDARIPPMYFQTQPSDFKNTQLYIPAHMFSATAHARKMGIVLPPRKLPTLKTKSSDLQTSSASKDGDEEMDEDDDDDDHNQEDVFNKIDGNISGADDNVDDEECNEDKDDDDDDDDDDGEGGGGGGGSGGKLENATTTIVNNDISSEPVSKRLRH